MKNGASRNVTSDQMSRRSVNQMFLYGSAGLVAFTESAAAADRTEGAATSAVEDRLAIKDLMHRYGMALDSLDKDALSGCFAPGALTAKSLDWVIDYHRKYEHTMHNMMNHVCTIQQHEAKSVTYAVASMVKRDSQGLTKFDVYFCYHDDLVKQDQRWFISKRQLAILFSSEATPVQAGAPLLDLPLTPGSFRTPPVLNYLKP